MNSTYYETVNQLENMGVDPDYLQGWVGGYLGNPQREEQRARATQLGQQQRVQEWIEGLRASAGIVDRRDEVLQPADSISPLTPYLPF